MEGHVSRWAVLIGTTKMCDTNPVEDAESSVHWNSSLKLLLLFFLFFLLSYFFSPVTVQTTHQGMKKCEFDFP